MKKQLIFIIMMFMLCGCWDQVNIQELQMSDVIGLDRNKKSDNENMKMSIAISTLSEAHQGGGKPGMQLISSEGYSLADNIEKLDYKLSGNLTFNQSRLYIFGKLFASNTPAEEMKILGRIPNSPLNANLAVFDEEVSELLKMEKIDSKTIANYLVVMITNAIKYNYTPKVTLFQFILGKQDPFKDFALPLIKKKGEDVQLGGSALFRAGNYTGIDLSMTSTKMAMLLKERKGGGVYLNTQLDDSSYQIWIQKSKKHIHVKSSDNKISEINLILHLQVNLIDSGKSNKALSQTKLDSIQKKLTDDLNQQALQTVQTLQKANCDFLELARELHAYHYKEWEHMNWREDYPKLIIRPDIKLQILNSGVML
ncbi:hypothetical protein PAECIP111891_02016 [Paenibacillus allorhizoplanae]|uniref:Ger(X)C family spore germination protein n=1 Tax=Paenibacillus allorhizoplanae TaxID=2905648 RepID=A0ABM9C4E4_9BACL|nr:Ger(x)C family spore germination protein [Paenibacillus allorhizoplanae]CAH1202175.1 hypothetical protein PAECIP111891_02016 [Paenibacillus allorhizoplanae]